MWRTWARLERGRRGSGISISDSVTSIPTRIRSTDDADDTEDESAAPDLDLGFRMEIPESDGDEPALDIESDGDDRTDESALDLDLGADTDEEELTIPSWANPRRTTLTRRSKRTPEDDERSAIDLDLEESADRRGRPAAETEPDAVDSIDGGDGSDDSRTATASRPNRIRDGRRGGCGRGRTGRR